MTIVASSLQTLTDVRTNRKISNQPSSQADESKNDVAVMNVENGSQKPNQDQYIIGEDGERAGLYQLGKDEEGNPKIIFHDPNLKKNIREVSQSERKPKKESMDEKDEEECTVNTDKVEAEIKRLKEKKEKLLQQIHQAIGDPARQDKLEKQLQQVESEICEKDNDSYKRQNAQYT